MRGARGHHRFGVAVAIDVSDRRRCVSATRTGFTFSATEVFGSRLASLWARFPPLVHGSVNGSDGNDSQQLVCVSHRWNAVGIVGPASLPVCENRAQSPHTVCRKKRETK